MSEDQNAEYGSPTATRNFDLDRGIAAGTLEEDESVLIKSEPEDEDPVPETELQIDLSQNLPLMQGSYCQQPKKQANRLHQLWWETVHSASQVIIQPPGISSINITTSGSSPNDSHLDSSAHTNQTKLLYKNGCCQWPGCSITCPTVFEFLGHLTSNHELTEKTIAQFQVQAHVVSQLETQLIQERTRLYAMYAYLDDGSQRGPSLQGLGRPHLRTTASNGIPTKQPGGQETEAAGINSVDPDEMTSQTSTRTSPKTVGPHGTDIEEIRQSLEPHRYVDQRPPFTYALLIRQAILESPDKQLTLNEVYEWFSRNFVYFKRNVATWKNAVRHNLSLHKCFVRVENLTTRGAVWMCDDQEFLRRRTQRRESHADLRSQPPFVRPTSYVFPPPPHPPQQNQVIVEPPVNSPLSSHLPRFDTRTLARSPAVMETVRMGPITSQRMSDHVQHEVDIQQRMLGRGLFIGHPTFPQTSIPIMSSGFFMHGGQPPSATLPTTIRYISSEEATAKWDGSDHELEGGRSHGSPDSTVLGNGGLSPVETTTYLSTSKREHQDGDDRDNPAKHPRS